MLAAKVFKCIYYISKRYVCQYAENVIIVETILIYLSKNGVNWAIIEKSDIFLLIDECGARHYGEWQPYVYYAIGISK
jgi:hypothetical protein